MVESSQDRQASRLSTFFARRRKNLNENLGLVVALLAAAFAGWSGYEAHKSRLETHEDTLLTLKLANRGYVVAESPEIVAEFSIKSGNVPVAVRPLAEGWQRSLLAKHLVKVYGNGTTPVFEVRVMADCQVGLSPSSSTNSAESSSRTSKLRRLPFRRPC